MISYKYTVIFVYTFGDFRGTDCFATHLLQKEKSNLLLKNI